MQANPFLLSEEQKQLMADAQSSPVGAAVAPVPVPVPAPTSQQLAQAIDMRPVQNDALTKLQQLLVPTPPAVTPPENLREGVTNLFQNRILRPLQYNLGLRESPKQKLDRLKTDAGRIANYNARVEALQKAAEYEAAQNIDLSQFGNTPYGEALRAARSSGDISTLVTALKGERDRFMTDDTKELIFFAELKNQNPQAYEAAVEMMDVLDPTESIKLARGFPQLTPDQQKIWLAKNLDEKQQILFNNGNDVDNYFEQIRKHEEKMVQNRVRAENGGLSLTSAQEEIDKKFAPIYSSWMLEGGKNTKVANISSLNQSIRTLESNKDITGVRYRGRPDVLLSEDTLALKENVAAVITQGMRQIIGSQFAKDEAEAFINRSFNVVLPANVNADRLRRLRSQMEGAYRSIEGAVNHYGANGTLSNWDTGASSLTASLDDFEKNMYQPQDYVSLSNNDLTTIVNNPATSDYERNVIKQVAEQRLAKGNKGANN